MFKVPWEHARVVLNCHDVRPGDDVWYDSYNQMEVTDFVSEIGDPESLNAVEADGFVTWSIGNEYLFLIRDGKCIRFSRESKDGGGHYEWEYEETTTEHLSPGFGIGDV